MSEPERPPLDPVVLEQISVMLHRIDKEHFSLLAHYQVSPDIAAPSPLRLPKTPRIVLSALRMYAGNLFKAEADHYEQFRSDGNYAPWLSGLAERVIARVLGTINAIESANRPATLAYHGLTDDEIREGLADFLEQIINDAAWNVPKSALVSKPVSCNADELEADRRKALLSEYKIATGNPSNKSIYEAANSGIYKPEFYQWLNGSLTDESKITKRFEAFLKAKKRPVPRKLYQSR